MPTYLVNKRPQPTGEHEVHTTACEHKPDRANQLELGFFSDCHGALRKAKEHFSNVDGCAFCCPDCHKR
jgi:hypothetical protein